jgi:hypothetical protein
MKRFILTEKLSLDSFSDGVEITAKSLITAKRMCAMRRLSQGTVLVISDLSGQMRCYKEYGKNWTSA